VVVVQDLQRSGSLNRNSRPKYFSPRSLRLEVILSYQVGESAIAKRPFPFCFLVSSGSDVVHCLQGLPIRGTLSLEIRVSPKIGILNGAPQCRLDALLPTVFYRLIFPITVFGETKLGPPILPLTYFLLFFFLPLYFVSHDPRLFPPEI